MNRVKALVVEVRRREERELRREKRAKLKRERAELHGGSFYYIY